MLLNLKEYLIGAERSYEFLTVSADTALPTPHRFN
jgi:hypothetical protein